MKMLLCCSNPVFRGFLSDRLSLDGNEMTAVPGSREAFRALLRTTYELILIVTNRPCCKEAHFIRLASRRNRVMVLSSVYDEEMVMDAYRMGVHAYMTLPVDTTRLIKKIRSYR